MDKFLPEDYEAPVIGGSYTKIEEGDTRIRILGSPIFGWGYWVKKGEEKRPVRLKYTKENYARAVAEAEKNEDKNDRKVKHFWNLKVYNYKTKQVEILEITQKQLQAPIRILSQSDDWGNPANRYDITIKREGSGMDSSYAVISAPPKDNSPEVNEAHAKTPVDLEALYYGADPFDIDWKETCEEYKKELASTFEQPEATEEAKTE